MDDIILTSLQLSTFLVEDLPVYVLVTLLKAENSVKYHNIVPFLSPLHTQCSMMTAIYKRYKGSELEDIFVVGEVIADSSVDQALKGKHFKRGLHSISVALILRSSLGFSLLDSSNACSKEHVHGEKFSCWKPCLCKNLVNFSPATSAELILQWAFQMQVWLIVRCKGQVRMG